MGGGLMQLVAYGAQDIYLTGNPQITFFKVVYRRHTNFSMEAIEQTLNGNAAYGSSVTCTISRNGDLVHKMYMQFNPKGVFTATTSPVAVASNLGHGLFKEMELEIGGQRIDKQYSDWLTIWNELTDPNPSGLKGAVVATTLSEPQMGATNYQRMSFNHFGAVDTATAAPAGLSTAQRATVPLQFWFCRNPGLALPLIALQYHEVKVKIQFCGIADMTSATTGFVGATTLNDIKLFCDYIYLDTDERRRFAQVSHEYLIEQIQRQDFGATETNCDLNFNHPVKELIFTGVPETGLQSATINSQSGPATPGMLTAGDYQLKLNGHDRFSLRARDYFTRTQVNQHHIGFGGTTVLDSIGVYSFALKPEEHQPSGTCNFSRIDNAQLVCPAQAAVSAPANTQAAQAITAAVPTFASAGRGSQKQAGGLRVYAVNYNVLRIMSGMGGLAYSN